MAVTEETLLAAADIRRRINRMTDNQVIELTRAWVDAWDTLAPLFSEALVELLTGAEGNIRRSVVSRNRRLRQALQQAKATLTELTRNANELILNDVSDAVLDAVAGHQQIISTQLPPGTVGVQVNLDAPAPDAIDAIVTRTTQQIHASTIPLADWVVTAMKQELVRGIVLGDNPNKVARDLIRRTEGHFNGGLARAIRIARTEMLDAHREGSLAAAKTNKDLLTGWRWLATLDARTCPSCIAKHGTVHGLDEFGPEDHQQGRCARVDIVKSWRDLGFNIDEPEDTFPDARDWYDGLDEATQLQIMGATRKQLLDDGLINWEDLSTLRKTPAWRDSYGVTSIKDLQSIAG